MPHQLHNQLRIRTAKRAWLTRKPLMLPLLVFALALLSVIISAITTETSERARREQRLSTAVMELERAIRQVATTHSAMLRGSALFLSRVEVSREEFEVLARSGTQSLNTQIADGVGWGRAERGASGGGIGTVRVTYLAPDSARNRRAIGFDMYGETGRRAAIDRAIATQQPVATAPVVLAQEGRQSNRPGFLLYMPVMAPDLRPKGVVYTAYQGDRMLAALRERMSRKPAYIDIRDVNAPGAPRLATVGRYKSGMRLGRREVQFAGRTWELMAAMSPSPVIAASTRRVLLIGLLLSAAALMLAWLFVRSALEEREFLDWQTAQLQVRDTLVRELNHRVKNTLANVLSIITLTRRKATDLDSFADGLTGRIRALSATHDILTAGQWARAMLESVVRAELAPYSGEASRAEISGPEILLASNTALSLGLAIHELATNASKYGALSVPEGRVSVRWSVVEPGVARIDWREYGGPPVTPTPRPGFGTDLLKKIVAHDLGREVTLDFAPEGLCCTLFVPVREVPAFDPVAGARIGGGEIVSS